MTDPRRLSLAATTEIAKSTDVGAVLHALQHLVSSAEPAVVLTSLVTISGDVLSDECRVYLEEDNCSSYFICHPRATANDLAASADYLNPQLDERTVSTPIAVPPEQGDPGYRGVIVHRWHAPYRPTPVDAALARVAVDQAVALIGRQRSDQRARNLESKVDHLETALASNRAIGTALGILMITHHISEPQAFDMLRTASQNRHRKLRDLASDVVYTGALEPQVAT